MNTPNGLQEIIDAFGDLRPYIGEDGTLSPDWQKDWMIKVALPFSMPLDWNRGTSVSVMTCHKLLGETFLSVFDQIMSSDLQAAVKTFGGCFAYRPQRGSTKLSTHAWGIAIDLNPFENAQGTDGNMDMNLVALFRQNGFEWGGDFSGTRKDPMHFQFATGY